MATRFGYTGKGWPSRRKRSPYKLPLNRRQYVGLVLTIDKRLARLSEKPSTYREPFTWVGVPFSWG